MRGGEGELRCTPSPSCGFLTFTQNIFKQPMKILDLTKSFLADTPMKKQTKKFKITLRALEIWF